MERSRLWSRSENVPVTQLGSWPLIIGEFLTGVGRAGTEHCPLVALKLSELSSRMWTPCISASFLETCSHHHAVGEALKDVCALCELLSQGARHIWGVLEPRLQKELDTSCMLTRTGQMQGWSVSFIFGVDVSTQGQEHLNCAYMSFLSCIVKCCEVGWCCSHIYINAKFRNQESDGFILPSDCCPVYSLGPQGILSGNTGLIGGKRNKNEKQRTWVPGPSDVSAEFGCLHTFFWADDRQLLSDSQSTN